MKKKQKQLNTSFAICVNNYNYEASLEIRKIYQTISDSLAKQHNQIRVIDESGEDYLYPEEYFALIDLPESIQRIVFNAA